MNQEEEGEEEHKKVKEGNKGVSEGSPSVRAVYLRVKLRLVGAGGRNEFRGRVSSPIVKGRSVTQPRG
jgi:hypothetical protein